MRRVRIGAALAILTVMVWIALLAATVTILTRADPHGPLPHAAETLLTGMGTAVAVFSVAAWLLAIRLLGEDPDVSPDSRRMWWVLLIVFNLFSAPVYLTVRYRRSLRTR